MKFKAWKIFAPALALLAALVFTGCIWDSDSSTIIWYYPGSQETGEYPSSGMTQTQSATASSSPITVSPATKTLVLSGVSGKTIYMARTNAKNTELSKNLTRTAQIDSGASSSAANDFAAAKSAGGIDAESLTGGAQAFGLPNLESAKETDPHARIYQLYLDNLEAAKKTGISKSLAPAQIQAAVQNYNVGDTETFWALNPNTMNSFDKRTFKLLISENDYNIWVYAADPYYNKNAATFQTAAETLGEKFINGYNLVSHIYGESSSYIYNADYSKYGPMSTYSKTGTKINILLYEMLDAGSVYGFVYHGDVVKGAGGSNEGRFLYMDSKTLMQMPMEAYSTALHEFSHTISKNQKTLINGKEWTYWYGELLAMMCEDMMQAYLGITDSEVDGNMAYTPKARLPTANYNTTWANGLTGQEAATYSATFMLGAWLSRKFGGVKLIRELARNNAVDLDSILAAIKTVTGKTYTVASLLQEYEGDKLVHAASSGFDQDGTTHSGNETYTHNYSGGTYLYPTTAINLWDNFYGWCDTSGYSNISGKNYISNTEISFSQLPAANLYKKGKWKGATPTDAYLGPLLISSGLLYANIGPYGSMLFKLGTATNNTVTINFGCVGGNSFSDTITIYVK